ncbi:S-adenosyl-L-methionine-dependent methyltransferases superfamily protein [Euphorbia peplus]|nr:S-adenosyl-L-methionine-dependent methyltransferases superfamily protein [Euphorbia peplus]
MAIARLVRHAKRPYGLCAKMSAVAVLGLCFIFVWSLFSSSSSAVTTQRESFDDIAEPVPARRSNVRSEVKETQQRSKIESKGSVGDEKKMNRTPSVSGVGHEKGNKDKRVKDSAPKSPTRVEKEEPKIEESGNEEEEDEEEGVVVDGREEANEGQNEGNGDENGEKEDSLSDTTDEESETVEKEKAEEDSDGDKSAGKKRKIKGPLFDPKARYSWRLCSTRSKHNYIPCIDIESGSGRVQSYRHTERSCPRSPPMCVVPLPHEGYGIPVPWPESKSKILYKNVAHPKLDAFVKKNSWLVHSGEFLTFPQNQSELKGGVQHYLESIEEMVPDIEWGKNIRVVLDIGCRDSSFLASLLDKDVLTLSLGLKDDLVDLAQIALERGFPAVVSPFGTRRLAFPSGVFDAIHCGECSIPWHSHGGKLLLEMNRILRPGGYFILSTKRENIEEEEAMIALIASICWNVLAHKTDEVSEVGVKIYQKPEANDIYELRRKKIPPLCKENENPDAAWYVPMKTCLHVIPSSIEQHGTEWPEEWPARLETYPDWMNNKEKITADTNHWKAIVEKSYLTGIGIDWSKIHNIMDMKAVFGGFAAAFSKHKVWVMNVVPVHAPDTLPIIYERGLAGVYHDWCESFGTYPRSYDLLHADHLFSRLKNRCKQPVSIVVEMDRILRPGGWVIIREKVEILDPLEEIVRSLHWEIRMAYTQNKEGILCAQKTMWRP